MVVDGAIRLEVFGCDSERVVLSVLQLCHGWIPLLCLSPRKHFAAPSAPDEGGCAVPVL
jgi:hypothetical protein